MTSRGEIDDLKRRIIDGLRILTYEDVLYGAGHLSARIPGTNHILINPRYPGNLADIHDLCVVDIDTCKRLEGPGPIPSETHIHTEIYKVRPDVQSVTHCHPRYTTLMGLLDRPWVPFHNPSAVFADGIGVYPEAHLVDSAELGANLARCLGDHYAVFQRGHGCSVAGPGPEGAVMLALQLEHSCEEALAALKLQELKPLSNLGFSKEQRNARMQNDYRTWPYLLQKHGLYPKDVIKKRLDVPAEGTMR